MAGNRVDNETERTLHANLLGCQERKGYRYGGVLSSGMAGEREEASDEALFWHVQTTTDSRAEAVELAHDAVAARLAACAQVSGPVASTFWWEDSIERAEEWIVLLKLPAARYAELADFLLERHSYEEPEIIATPIVAGSPSYLDWISEETTPR